MKNYKKCRPAIDDACAAIFDAQSKLKRNAALLRHVRSLKRQNFSLRKANRALRLQVRLDKEAIDKLNDPILCYQMDSCEKPQHEDLSREIVVQIPHPTFVLQKPKFTAQRGQCCLAVHMMTHHNHMVEI
jgi:hypothetical protein